MRHQAHWNQAKEPATEVVTGPHRRGIAVKGCQHHRWKNRVWRRRVRRHNKYYPHLGGGGQEGDGCRRGGNERDPSVGLIGGGGGGGWEGQTVSQQTGESHELEHES